MRENGLDKDIKIDKRFQRKARRLLEVHLDEIIRNLYENKDEILKAAAITGFRDQGRGVNRMLKGGFQIEWNGKPWTIAFALITGVQPAPKNLKPVERDKDGKEIKLTQGGGGKK